MKSDDLYQNPARRFILPLLQLLCYIDQCGVRMLEEKRLVLTVVSMESVL